MTREAKNERARHAGLARCVEHMGSISKLARAINCDHSQVSRWVYLKRKIPPVHVMNIAKACGCVKARELRPDVFGRRHLKGVKRYKGK